MNSYFATTVLLLITVMFGVIGYIEPTSRGAGFTFMSLIMAVITSCFIFHKCK
ncbi:hypothetical protein VP249E411_P0053 [Vibrio phage 249E41-1]|nr:hypothetical protein VP249E411_P0053 [Vibrio phage 249E41-1]